jgi:pimeloyl-ACP methyl ester carboxylesterase
MNTSVNNSRPIPSSTSSITRVGEANVGDVELVYDVFEPKHAGSSVPVVLHHGFAADVTSNWVRPGLIGALLGEGRTVIAVDARGHGRSSKPRVPGAYGHRIMSDDLRALLAHIEHPQVDLVGYSMGAYVSGITAVRQEPRLRSLVLGGIGKRALIEGVGNQLTIADALEADDPKGSSDPMARSFRRFADATGADRIALAAIMRAPFYCINEIERIAVPTLVVAGRDDELARDAHVLSDRIPGARMIITEGDHLGAIALPGFHQAIIGFLQSLDEAK